MNNKRFLNLLSGCIVGFLAGNILITEGNFISYYVLTDVPSWVSRGVRAAAYSLSALLFFFIIWRFSKNRGRGQGLTSYYLKAVLLSAASVVLAVYLVMLSAARLLSVDFLNRVSESRLGMFVLYNLLYVLLVFLVFIFSGVFSCIAKKKIIYIQLLSREVKKIENEGFGRQIEVCGEDELADLCRSINHMSRELLRKEEKEKRMEQQRKELITNVSHDLRSPLTSIIGYVELLKNSSGEDTQKLQEYIGVVERRLQGLNHLINELFELTKLDSEDARLHLERIEITALIRHMAEEYVILYKKQGFSVTKSIEERKFYMGADLEKLARAIQNLLDNAGKYAKAGGHIEITACIQGQEGAEQLKLSISNELEETERPPVEQLFERSCKGDTARSDSEGSGLGLAIARRITELHGGILTAGQAGNRITFDMCFFAEE